MRGRHHKNGISARGGRHKEAESVTISAAKPLRLRISVIEPSASMWPCSCRCMELHCFELPCTSFIHLVSYGNKAGIFYCQNAKVSELITHEHTQMMIRPLHSLFQHLAKEATCIWAASNIWIQVYLCVWRSRVRPAALLLMELMRDWFHLQSCCNEDREKEHRKDTDSGGILWLTKREKLQSRKLCADAAHPSFWSNKRTRPKDKTFLFDFDYILKSRYNRSFGNESLIRSSAIKKNTLMLVGNIAGGVLDPALSWTYPQPYHSSCYHHFPAIIPIFFLCLSRSPLPILLSLHLPVFTFLAADCFMGHQSLFCNLWWWLAS